jgi:3-dehydroquinate synthase
MNFKVDDKILNLEKLNKDEFCIKSHPLEYSVSIKRDTPADVLRKTYSKGDVVLVDEKLLQLGYFDSCVSDMVFYPVTAIEDNKNISTCLSLVSFLSEMGFNKGNTLHVVGGGIIQDIGSFTSAVYKRGIGWILYPSTLLSMCDSCIGGKNGINFNGTKNQLALFSSPRQVIICTKFIGTLEDREIKSGLGEVLKLVAMGGNNLLEKYLSIVKDGQVVSEDGYDILIKDSLDVKKQIIEEDEFELSIRRSLNYGHTIGHALETLSEYEIPHGEAVAMGMLLINKMYTPGVDLLNQACYDIINTERLRSINTESLKKLILEDKKTVGNKTTFIALKDLGEVVFVEETIDDQLMERIVYQIRNI